MAKIIKMRKNEFYKKLESARLEKSNYNKTTRFLLSALDLDERKISFKMFKYFGFVNCYLSHKGSIHNYKNCLYLVFNPTGEVLKDFGKFYDLYSKPTNFVTDYVVDKNLIVVVFKIKDRWLSCLTHFLESKFSQMPKSYAELFKSKNYTTGEEEYNKEYHVITKSKQLREEMEKDLDVKINPEWELESPVDYNKEIFIYEPGNKTQI